jgi:Asp-tRNA(Asn)/Glu-tRNA(Gln) amidotransferase A subunit family amidase
MNGQGPIASTIDQLRVLVDVAAPRLRTGPARPFTLRGAFVYAPERAAAGRWPRFADEVTPMVERAVGEARLDHGLPGLLRARTLAGAVWSSHVDEVLASCGFGDGEARGAIASSLVLRGALGDRRLHPHTAFVLAMVALGHATLYSDPRGALDGAHGYRDAVRALWDRGYLLVAPTFTVPAPRHGRTFFHFQALALPMAGNLADATALAIPFGRYDDGFPRSLQILGPPGSEQAVLDAGERLLRALQG